MKPIGDRFKDCSRIESADITDADSIKDCVCAAYQHYIERIGKAPGPMLDDYEARIRENEVYVIREQGKVAGVLVLMLTAERLLLDNIAVHPECQGEGLGKQLMEFAEKRAVEAGYTSIELYTHEVMTENIKIYEKLGYLEIYRITEKGYQRVYMKKDLETIS